MNMEEKRKKGYTRKVTVRFKELEFKYLEIQLKKTTCRKLSEYVRKMVLQQPVVLTYRNASADAFLTEMIELKNELSAIGNNFNQAVKKLHTLNLVPEVRLWLVFNESAKEAFMKRTEDIKGCMNQIYEQWLQK
jgi:hypothetical protein